MSLEVTAVPLAADFDAWYSSTFTSKMRRNMRRRLEKLKETGAVEFSLASDGQQRIEAFSVFQAQKSAQLKRTQESSPFDNPAIQSFYRDFLGSSDVSGQHLTGVLRVGDTVAAVELCVGFQDRVYALNRSMTDGDFRQCSPGWQLNTWLIQRSCSEGYSVYDLGPGSSEYKDVFKNYKISCFSTIVALKSAAIPLTTSMRLLAHGKYSVSTYLDKNPAHLLRLEGWYNKLRGYADRILRRSV
jgi:CelD/BcsL family acetyltransferase involved in cellulose biosynthesis